MMTTTTTPTGSSTPTTTIHTSSSEQMGLEATTTPHHQQHLLINNTQLIHQSNHVVGVSADGHLTLADPNLDLTSSPTTPTTTTTTMMMIKQELEDEESMGEDDDHIDEDALIDDDDDLDEAAGLIKPAIENILSSPSSQEEEEEEESEESVSEFQEDEDDEQDQLLLLPSFNHHHNGSSSSSTPSYGGGGIHFSSKSTTTPTHTTSSSSMMTTRQGGSSQHHSSYPKYSDSSLTLCGGGGGERKKREAFTLQQKLQVLKFLETHSVNATSRFYKVDPKSIRLWRSQKAKIQQTVQEELLTLQQQGETDGITPRKRISGAGRKKRNNKVIVEIEENPNKRHRRTIKLSDKVEIIRLIENGQTQSDVARSLGISQSTVQTIWSNKGDILERNQCPKKKRKNLHWKKYSTIDNALFNWVRQVRDTGLTTLDTKMIQDKAVEYAEYYKQPEFKIQANRWVDVFKRRHSLGELDRQERLQLAAASAIASSTTTTSLGLEQQTLGQLTNITSQISHHLQQQSSSSSNTNNHPHPSSNHHQHHNHHLDLVPEFDLSSLPGLMAGLYPPDPTSVSSSNSLIGSVQPGPTSSSSSTHLNFNSHLPAVPVLGGPVTTCDAMKYVELIRAWICSTFGVGEEVLNNHLNAIENAVLKRRMTEMMMMTTPNITNNHHHR